MNNVIYTELIILYVLCMNTNKILVHLFNVKLLVQDKYFFNSSIHEVLVCSMYLTSSTSVHQVYVTQNSYSIVAFEGRPLYSLSIIFI